MKIIADLSQVEKLGIKDHNGKLWTFPNIEERNTVQSLAFQRYGESLMAVDKATKTRDPRAKELIGFSGLFAVQLLVNLLTDEAGESPDEDYAAEIAAAGGLNHIQKALRPPSEDDTRKILEDFDLDEFYETLERPTPAEAPAST